MHHETSYVIKIDSSLADAISSPPSIYEIIDSQDTPEIVFNLQKLGVLCCSTFGVNHKTSNGALFNAHSPKGIMRTASSYISLLFVFSKVSAEDLHALLQSAGNLDPPNAYGIKLLTSASGLFEIAHSFLEGSAWNKLRISALEGAITHHFLSLGWFPVRELLFFPLSCALRNDRNVTLPQINSAASKEHNDNNGQGSKKGLYVAMSFRLGEILDYPDNVKDRVRTFRKTGHISTMSVSTPENTNVPQIAIAERTICPSLHRIYFTLKFSIVRVQSFSKLGPNVACPEEMGAESENSLDNSDKEVGNGGSSNSSVYYALPSLIPIRCDPGFGQELGLLSNPRDDAKEGRRSEDVKPKQNISMERLVTRKREEVLFTCYRSLIAGSNNEAKDESSNSSKTAPRGEQHWCSPHAAPLSIVRIFQEPMYKVLRRNEEILHDNHIPGIQSLATAQRAYEATLRERLSHPSLQWNETASNDDNSGRRPHTQLFPSSLLLKNIIPLRYSTRYYEATVALTIRKQLSLLAGPVNIESITTARHDNKPPSLAESSTFHCVYAVRSSSSTCNSYVAARTTIPFSSWLNSLQKEVRTTPLQLSDSSADINIRHDIQPQNLEPQKEGRKSRGKKSRQVTKSGGVTTSENVQKELSPCVPSSNELRTVHFRSMIEHIELETCAVQLDVLLDRKKRQNRYIQQVLKRMQKLQPSGLSSANTLPVTETIQKELGDIAITDSLAIPPGRDASNSTDGIVRESSAIAPPSAAARYIQGILVDPNQKRKKNAPAACVFRTGKEVSIETGEGSIQSPFAPWKTREEGDSTVLIGTLNANGDTANLSSLSSISSDGNYGPSDLSDGIDSLCSDSDEETLSKAKFKSKHALQQGRRDVAVDNRFAMSAADNTKGTLKIMQRKSAVPNQKKGLNASMKQEPAWSLPKGKKVGFRISSQVLSQLRCSDNIEYASGRQFQDVNSSNLGRKAGLPMQALYCQTLDERKKRLEENPIMHPLLNPNAFFAWLMDSPLSTLIQMTKTTGKNSKPGHRRIERAMLWKYISTRDLFTVQVLPNTVQRIQYSLDDEIDDAHVGQMLQGEFATSVRNRKRGRDSSGNKTAQDDPARHKVLSVHFEHPPPNRQFCTLGIFQQIPTLMHFPVESALHHPFGPCEIDWTQFDSSSGNLSISSDDGISSTTPFTTGTANSQESIITRKQRGKAAATTCKYCLSAQSDKYLPNENSTHALGGAILQSSRKCELLAMRNISSPPDQKINQAFLGSFLSPLLYPDNSLPHFTLRDLINIPLWKQGFGTQWKLYSNHDFSSPYSLESYALSSYAIRSVKDSNLRHSMAKVPSTKPHIRSSRLEDDLHCRDERHRFSRPVDLSCGDIRESWRRSMHPIAVQLMDIGKTEGYSNKSQDMLDCDPSLIPGFGLRMASILKAQENAKKGLIITEEALDKGVEAEHGRPAHITDSEDEKDSISAHGAAASHVEKGTIKQSVAPVNKNKGTAKSKASVATKVGEDETVLAAQVTAVGNNPDALSKECEVKHLKAFCKLVAKVPVSGTKKQLVERIINYFSNSA